MTGSNKLPPGIWAMNWPPNTPPKEFTGSATAPSVEPFKLAPVVVEGVELQPPLKDGERGALISMPCPLQPIDGGVMPQSSSFDPDVVRGALLLFDRFDYPDNNMFGFGEQRPEGLEEMEAFKRSRVTLSGGLSADVWELSIAEVFSALQKREEGLWAVARGPLQNCLPKEVISPQVGLQLKMLNALPLPDRSVPYDEVLTFKQRHTAELGELRGYLDELAIDFVKNGETPLAQAAAFEKFDRALGAYAEATRKANFAKRLFSLDLSFSLSDAARAGFAALGTNAAATVALQASPQLAAAGAALVAGLSASVGLKRHKQSVDLAPFEYVFHAKDLL